MALIYHATLSDLLPTVGEFELVAGNGAVINVDHLSLPNYNSGVYLETPLVLGSTYTISMWFKDLKNRSVAASGWMQFDGTSEGGGTNGNHAGFAANYTATIYTNDELGAWDSAFRSSGYAMTQANFTGTGWHHLVASFDNGTLTYYIDGAQVGSPVAYAGGSSIEVFGSWLNYSYGIADYIDDIQVYDNALSAGDVSTLFAGGRMQLTDGLVAKYALDTDGSDSIGSNDGTATGVTFENGYASFSAGDEITTGPTAFFDSMPAGSTNKTLSAWVKIDSYTPAQSANGMNSPAIIAKGDLSNGAIYSVMGINDGYPSFYWFDGSSAREFKSTTRINLGAWVHLSLVIDDSNTLTYYVNGVATGDNGLAFNGMAFANGGKFSIGAGVTHSNSQSMRFVGDMDDLRVWSRALGASEIATLHAAGAEPYVPPALTDDLVAKYALDTDATDSVGSNDGTATGVTFDSGYATFDGASHISMAHDATSQPFHEENSSVSMWIKTSASGEERLFFKGYGPSSNESLWDHRVKDGKAYFYWREETGATYVDLTSTTSVNDGSWHHVVISRSGSDISMYVDGSLEDTTTGAIGTWSSTYEVHLGKWDHPSYAASHQFTGDMDDLRVWSRALGASEVTALHAAGAEAAAAAPPAGNTVDVTFLMQDSYGDGWNGSTFQIYDADSNIVESHTLAGGYSQTVQFDLDAEPYTWAFVNQNWMSEITATLTRDDTSEQLLFSSAGSVLSGAFDLSPATPDISPTLSASNGDITVSATVNAEATAAGAIGWAYSLSPLGAEGQPHGGTLLALGVDGTVSPTPHGVHTVYVAAVDASGNVIVSNSSSIDNTPSISITIVKADSYNDSWDGSSLVITNSGGVEVYNATLAHGASPQTITADLPYGTYDWAMVGGSYHNEHTVTITLTSDGSQLAHSAGHSPSSGSFTVGPPAAAISATVSVSGADITVTGVANATAVSEGAALWSASLTEYGEVGAPLDGAKMVTALGVDARSNRSQEAACKTVYVAVVDASGLIIAKSSVDASVFIFAARSWRPDDSYDLSFSSIFVAGRNARSIDQ